MEAIYLNYDSKSYWESVFGKEAGKVDYLKGEPALVFLELRLQQ